MMKRIVFWFLACIVSVASFSSSADAAQIAMNAIGGVAYTAGMTVDLASTPTMTATVNAANTNVQFDLLDGNGVAIRSSFISRNFSGNTIVLSTLETPISSGLSGLGATFVNGTYGIKARLTDCSTYPCVTSSQTFTVTQYRNGFDPTSTTTSTTSTSTTKTSTTTTTTTTTTQRVAYSDNKDGTVTDPTTGLTWMRCAMGQTWSGTTCTGTASTHTFDQANALTGKVTFAGQGDWRLPTIRELQTIVDRTVFNPAIDTRAFPNSGSSYFWSGSPDADDSNYAWYVYFDDGDASSYNRSGYYSVRLVRGGQSFGLLDVARPSSDYVDNGNGTVTHTPTQLMWKRCAEGQTWTGSTCSGSASGLTADQVAALSGNFVGQSDWRLPTQDELLSLVDYSTFNPAINTSIFPTAPSSYFWSGSPYAGNSNFAWSVFFSYGYASNYYRSNNYSVRLVRGGQSFVSLSLPLVLKQGWNLLGNSLKDQPMAVASVFNDPTMVNTVWKWDVATGGWQFYAPSMDAASLQAYVASKGYGLLSVINPGEGYWVNAKTASSLASQTGSAFKLTAEKLVTGWNLVATGNDVTPAAFNLSLSATSPASSTVPQNLTTLWAWDNPASQWYFYAPQLDASGGLANYITSKGYLDFTKNSKTLGKGQGFWVNKP